METVLEFEVYI